MSKETGICKKDSKIQQKKELIKKQSQLSQVDNRILNESYSELLTQLKHYWNTFSVDPKITSQYQASLSSLPFQKSSELVQFELNCLKSEDSLLINCIQTVAAREESLKGLKIMNQYLSDTPSWDKTQIVICECAEVLHAHRMITLSVVENIMTWISAVNYFSGSFFEFFFEANNYLDKLESDSSFFSQSEMAKVFCFSHENDPLLVSSANPVKAPVEFSHSNYFVRDGQIAIPIPYSMMGRVIEAQNFLKTRRLSPEFLLEVHRRMLKTEGSEKKTGKISEKMVLKAVIDGIIEEVICELLLYVAEKAAVDAIGRSIVFKWLDFTYGLKELVKGVIEGIKQGKVEQEKINKKLFLYNQHRLAGKRTKKNEISEFSREDSRHTVGSIPVASTRPSITVHLNEGESSLGRVMKASESIKGTKSRVMHAQDSKSAKSVKDQIVIKKIDKNLLNERLFMNENSFEKNKKIIHKQNIAMTDSPIRQDKSVTPQKSQLRGPGFKSVKNKLMNSINTSFFKEMKTDDRSEHSNLLNFMEKSPKLYTSSNSPIKKKTNLFEERSLNYLKNLGTEKSFAKASQRKHLKLAPLSQKEQNKEVWESFSQDSYKETSKVLSLDSIDSPVAEERLSKSNMSTLIAVEGIYRNLIEVLIKELSLHSMAEESIIEEASRTTRDPKAFQAHVDSITNSKLQQQIFASLVESVINQVWLTDLAKQVLEYTNSPRRTSLKNADFLEKFENIVIQEPEEFVFSVFTPRVHSPNNVLSRIDSVSEHTEISSIHEETKNPEKNNERFFFQIIKKSIKKMNHDYSEYLKILPETQKKYSLDLAQVMKIAYSGENCTWMWYMEDSVTKGLLGFCSEYKETLRFARVFHASTKTPAANENFIKESISLLKSSDFSFAIFEFSQSPAPFIKTFKQFNCELTATKPSVTVKFKETSQSYLGNSLSTILTTSESSKVLIGFSEPNPMMIEYGSRTVLALHFFRVLQENGYLDDVSEQSTSIRLQQELIELLGIIEKIKNFAFEQLVYAGFPQWKKSQLDLKFNWRSFSHFPMMVHSTQYLFFRFHRALVSENDHFSVFFTETTNPLVSVAFITYPNILSELKAEMRSQKTDVFWKVENLLNGSEEKKSLNGDLCVPGFEKEILWQVGWMKGFETQNERFLESCEEKFSWNSVLPNKIDNSTVGSGKVCIKDDFIAVVLQKDLEKLLDLPLFVVLVRKGDWIRL